MKTAKSYPIKLFVLMLLVSGVQYSCSSSKPAATTNIPTETDIPYTSMLDRLRRVPRLAITGPDYDPTILIRGSRSMESSNEPLFEIDGTIVGTGYSSIRSVDVNQVESIRVVTPAQAGLYGSRGANGVVKINTKD
jgi:outer membrane cobalamin receptor